MPLIKDNELVPDPWVTLGDDEALPEGAPAIVSFERWQGEREALIQRNAPLGIRLRSDQPPRPIAGDLDRFQVVALEFPRFGDGRAYSYARLLRERYGFGGELRAVGNVLRDQALFMLRCGFDAFEVAEGTSVEGWRESLAEISVFYQPTRDGRPTASALRRNCNGATPTPAADSLHDGDLDESSPGRSSPGRSSAEPAPSGLSAGPARPGPRAGHWAY